MNMSIHRVLNAKKGVDSSFMFFNNIQNVVVCIIGRIVSIETKGNCMYYTLHDGSGILTARQWIVLFSSPSVMWTVGDYVRVVGLPKEYRDSISLSIQHIELVSSCDVLVSHWLQAIYIALKYSSRQPHHSPSQLSYSVRNPYSHSVYDVTCFVHFCHSHLLTNRTHKPIINIPNPVRRTTVPVTSITSSQPTKPTIGLQSPSPVIPTLTSSDTSLADGVKREQELDDDILWGDTPLTLQQQSVLRVIQKFGIISAEGVSMATILQNSKKEGLSEKETVYVKE